MIQNVNEYIEPYVFSDKPIPYRGLFIYPVKMKNTYDFLQSYDILKVEKNKIADIDIIQMSYLEFILYKLIKNVDQIDGKHNYGEIWLEKFQTLMEICFHANADEVQILEEFNAPTQLVIHGEIINGQQFDEMIRIIMYQNIYEYDDSVMSDDFREVINEYYATKNKGLVMPSLEDKRDIILMHTSYNDETIEEMTYRRFERLFQTIVSKTDFLVNALFKSQGSKDPLDHWVYKKKRDKYEDAFTEVSQLKNKVGTV